MTSVDQVLVSASPGDAVTNAALGLRAALRRSGPSEMYAHFRDPALENEVHPLDRYGRRPSPRPDADLLVYHASIGQPEVAEFLHRRPERLVLVYHNISPASAFEPYDPAFARLLTLGREEVAGLRDRTVRALADSSYNASELEEMGYHDIRISPPVTAVAELLDVTPDPSVTERITGQDGPVFLSVGQILPHKRPDLLLQAFHVLTTYLLPSARLVMVGAARLPRYCASVRQLARELNLSRAWITGPVSPEALSGFYRHADVFVSTSEHEGFCVPLLEAFAFDLPVVARACAAVPETLDDAGIALPHDAGPSMVAEALALVAGEAELAETLVRAGRRRLVELGPERAAATSLGHILDLVPA